MSADIRYVEKYSNTPLYIDHQSNIIPKIGEKVELEGYGETFVIKDVTYYPHQSGSCNLVSVDVLMEVYIEPTIDWKY